LPGSSGFLMLQPYPAPTKKKYDGGNIQLLIELVSKIRNLRSENKVEPAKKIPMTIFGHGHFGNLEKNRADLNRLARISELTLAKEGEKVAKAAASMVNGIEIFIPMEGLVDPMKEKARLGREIQAIEGMNKGMKARLDNPGFVKNAPAAVVEKDKATLLQNEEKLAKLKAQWAQL
jgi:valyl-tRNA synthetase